MHLSAPPARPAAGLRGTWLLRMLLRQLSRGSLRVVSPSGAWIEHRAGADGPQAVLLLHRSRALRRLLTGGDLGFAQAYLDGDWSSPDPVALIGLAAANSAALEARFSGLAPLRLWRRLRHRRRDNTPRGSRRNIAFHYDLGNAFYRLWLDESMTYSAARALPPGGSLEAAQRDKRARVIELLRLEPGASVLEIGCGWGALACDMAGQGARVTGITLSREQLAWAREAAGPAPIELRLQDYRAVVGRFERIVSIEMIEAVGAAYWPAYFAMLGRSLAPGGRIVLQAITIREDRFESYRRRPDFIQTCIFPGGMLPTATIIAAQAQAAGLRVVECETFGAGYADTLAAWRERFEASLDAVRALGLPERFTRMWRYYLCYCEAGFRDGVIDVGLYVMEAAR